MSKGNMLLGYARGKVGSMVFSRANGEQITRAYNGSPTNNRTVLQMLQRTTFITANKFFTRGNQNFFKFSFEDKRQNESDFNAFMRNNIKNATMMSQYAFDEATYPALGRFLLTKGSLYGVPISYNKQGGCYDIIPTLDETYGTVGSFSTALIEEFQVQKGDIFTAVMISAEGSSTANTPSILPLRRGIVRWTIKQFTIDPDNQTSIQTYFGDTLVIDTSRPARRYALKFGSDTDNIQAACVTISRNSRRGVKVSTSQLIFNEQAEQAFNACQTPEYKQDVINSWDATPESILEGSQSLTLFDKVGFKGFAGTASYVEALASIATTGVGEQLAEPWNFTTNEIHVRVEALNLKAFDSRLVKTNSARIKSVIFDYQRSDLILFEDASETSPGETEVKYDGIKIFSYVDAES